MSEFDLLKRVARNIRYQDLPELQGKVVRIVNWDSIESSIVQFVNRRTSIQLMNEFELVNHIALIKYGILDITFQTLLSILPPVQPRGVRLLKTLGWLDAKQFVEVEENSPLFELWKDMEKSSTYLRLYLRATDSKDVLASTFLSTRVFEDKKTQFVVKQLQRLKRPTYDFPNDFQVYDAFLSNARDLRIWKNFYL